MELNGVVNYFEGKSVLVTGATGMIGKLLVVRILSMQPKVKKLFLVVRAKDQPSAKLRIERELGQSDLVKALRDGQPDNTEFTPWFWSKVHPIDGDISLPNFGHPINNEASRKLHKEVDVIVNLGAATSHFGRYDEALDANTYGVKHVLDFARKCIALRMILHVSTAFMGKHHENRIYLEKPVDGISIPNIEEEKRVVEENLKMTRGSGPAVSARMKELGFERARRYECSEAYALTKMMGEMVAYGEQERLPVTILRPTMTTGTLIDPFPGWIQGIRTIDLLIYSYSKGNHGFLADPSSIVDLVPADFVVNAMLAVIAGHRQGASEFIYTIGSSMQNPLTFQEMISFAYHYFRENPRPLSIGPMGSGGVRRLQPPRMMSTPEEFDQYLKEQDIRNAVLIPRVKRAMSNFYFFHGRFDDSNMRRLMGELDVKSRELFYFDTKSINWKDYLMNKHIPGLFKYGTPKATGPAH